MARKPENSLNASCKAARLLSLPKHAATEKFHALRLSDSCSHVSQLSGRNSGEKRKGQSLTLV